MHIDLSGKTAIVTGSTAGIGLAIARGLATAGAKVVVNGRTEAAVEKAVPNSQGAPLLQASRASPAISARRPVASAWRAPVHAATCW
jgi:NAD(P)-dependent dehydrogenase (short-subunit alcohol dehydrogenase family)